jgi:recA bacterial DNA recombination protein
MKSAALESLEALLGAKKLAGTLTPAWATPAGVSPTGIPQLDVELGGGWRRGEISELIGGRSTGRTIVLARTLSAATAAGGVVALVDALDRLDPRSMAMAGVDLHRLLWIRGPALTVELSRPTLVDEALHRAIRAFDLVIRAGGFSVVALDLADIPPRSVRALPWATWLRLAHANEGRPTSGVLVGDGPMGRSARGASVTLTGKAIWKGASRQSRQLEGFEIRQLAPPVLTQPQPQA